MSTALISVSDKTGLVEFLNGLKKHQDYKFLATSSTAKHLKENGIDCSTVESLTKFPEILGGRVKTLHPNVFAGILARATDEDRKCLKELGLDEIDLVVVNLYPFEKKLKEKLEENKMVEEIDIGGVSLIRAAAKNFDRVSIVCEPSQYKPVLEAVGKNGGKFSKEIRRELARDAFERTSNYDQAIFTYLHAQTEQATCGAGHKHAHDAAQGSGGTSNGGTECGGDSLPSLIKISLSQYQKLRYGENPHQSAVWYAPPPGHADADLTFPPFEQLQGKELSSNNIVDTYALVRFLKELDRPAACIIKHNNPCGVALGKTLDEAFEKAYSTDPLSAFGGIFGFTGEVGGDLAQKVVRDFIEIVAAPSFSPEAMEVLKKKKNVRVLRLKPGILEQRESDKWQTRDMRDFGWIIERSEEPTPEVEKFNCVTGDFPNHLKSDIKFAWGVVKHLTSNAIFVAKDGWSLGFGIGQTSRVASVKIALAQAGDKARGAVLASDAFFPATDNIEEAAKAGISVIVQPGGSIKDADVIAACKEKGITMLFTGQRCFKH